MLIIFQHRYQGIDTYIYKNGKNHNFNTNNNFYWLDFTLVFE